MIPKGNQYINIISKSYMIVYNWFEDPAAPLSGISVALRQATGYPGEGE